MPTTSRPCRGRITGLFLATLIAVSGSWALWAVYQSRSGRTPPDLHPVQAMQVPATSSVHPSAGPLAGSPAGTSTLRIHAHDSLSLLVQFFQAGSASPSAAIALPPGRSGAVDLVPAAYEVRVSRVESDGSLGPQVASVPLTISSGLDVPMLDLNPSRLARPPFSDRNP